ncbi:MAG: hypothetical protein RIQ93_1245 [Verrucomicrobiota bacterium]|jgi:hypothetical protein
MHPQRRLDPGHRFVGAALVMLALAGCAVESASVVPTGMPRLAPPPQPEPVGMVSTPEALAEATLRAGANDVAGAARALESLPAAQRDAAAREFIAGLASRDPPRAGAVALALSPGLTQTAGLDLAASEFVTRDRAAAMKWALTQTAPASRFAAMQAIATQLMDRGPREAADLLLALPETGGRTEILALALAQWSRRDASAALAWAQQLPAGELRQRVTASVGFAVAQTAPERALPVVDLLPEGRDRWLLLGAIGQTWVAQNAGAAMDWVRQLPAGEARDAAIAGIDAGMGIASSRGSPPSGLNGSRGRRVAGGGYPGVSPPPSPSLTALPLGAERDEALRRQFEERLRASPVRAADWLSSLPAPDRSDEMIARLTREWLLINPQAAETWLDQNIGSSTRKEQILEDARHFNPTLPNVPGR